MLVLTRKVDEAILIGDNIEISILSVEGDRVRIGIDAPRSLRIFRKELLVQTQNINKEAAQAPTPIFHLKDLLVAEDEKLNKK